MTTLRGRARALGRAGLLLLVLGAAGCAALGEKAKGRHPGDLDRVKVGMTEDKLYELIGQPKEVREGRGLDIQTSVLAYPEGLVHVRRLVVTKVELGATLADRPERSIDTATRRYISSSPLHTEDMEWYQQDAVEEEEQEKKRNMSSDRFRFRPSVSK